MKDDSTSAAHLGYRKVTDSMLENVDHDEIQGTESQTIQPELVTDKKGSNETRPQRTREPISYSDFYKINHGQSDSEAATGKKAKARVLKFKVKSVVPEVQSPNSMNGSTAHGAKSTQSQTPVIHNPFRRSTSIAKTHVMQEVLLLPNSDQDEIAIIPAQRERATTSPLSSVPSDLDENDELETDFGTLTNVEGLIKKRRVTNGPRSANQSTTKKRSASQAEGGNGGERRHKANKKIKISSPEKRRRQAPVELGVLPYESRAHTSTEIDRMRIRDDDQGSNDGHCSTCHGTGKLLCCDDCPRSFHFLCIDPPIEEADIPDEPYYCMSCWDKRYGFPRPGHGFFKHLLSNQVVRDPSIFQLPADIRSFFDNATGEAGEYQETRDQKVLRKDRNGFAEEADTHRIRDRQHKPILCYKCGLSALGSSGIASCDHCSAHWHYDCVTPPLPGPPSALKKWMCPLHACDVTPTTRKPRKHRLISTTLTRGFRNRGDIDIELASDGEVQSSASESESDDDENQLWAPGMVDLPRVKYRLPEHGVVLDFLDTCRTSITNVEEDEQEEAQNLRSLPMFDTAEFEQLVAIATDELSSFDTQQEERVQLLAIKALLSVKGKDKILAFLNKDD